MQVRRSIPSAAHRSPRKTGTAVRRRGASGPDDALTRLHGVIGEVAEEAIDAERIEGFVFRRRFALEVGGQALRLAAEGPGEHLEAGGMGILDHARRLHEDAVALVDRAVAIEIVRLAVVVPAGSPG